MGGQVTRRHTGSFSEECNLVLEMPQYQLYTGMALRTNVLVVPVGSQAKAPAPLKSQPLAERFAPIGFFAQTGLQNLSAGVAWEGFCADHHELRDFEVGEVSFEELADFERIRSSAWFEHYY